MKKKTVYVIFAAAFIALCLIPSVGMAVFGASKSVANETLASAPTLTEKDGSFNTQVLDETTEYLADRFFLRKELITLWAKFCAKCFNSSANSQVLLGKDGWLFFEETRDDYIGRTMSDAQLACAAHNLALMQEYAESRGAKFLFVIAPDKNSVYGQYMPSYIKHGEQSNASALFDMLNAKSIGYVDLFDSFSGDEQLYYSTDTHWNVKGAAVAADEIMSALGVKTYYSTADFTLDGAHRGDLYEMLYPADSFSEPDFVYVPGFRHVSRGATNNGEAINIETENESAEGSLMCYRDSFGNALYPYLAESFKAARFTRSVPYDLTRIESSGADTIIIELVERNISNLISSAPIMSAPRRVPGETRPCEGLLSLKAENGKTRSTANLVNISGDLSSIQCGDVSNAYIRSGADVYEAFLIENGGVTGFSAWLEAKDDAGYSVIIRSADGLLEYDAAIE